MSIPIHALAALAVCHVIGMSTVEAGVAQSTAPAGNVLEPKEVITAAAAAAVLAELVDRLVVEGVARVGADPVVLAVVFWVGAAEDLAEAEEAGLLAAEERSWAAGVGVACEL